MLRIPIPCAGAAALLWLGVASAATLHPGSQVVTADAGTDLGTLPQLQGTLLEDRTTRFSYEGWFRNDGMENGLRTGAVTGELQSRVVRSIDGTVDFHWRLSVDSGSFLSVASLSLEGWGPGVFNADWRTDAGDGVVPAWVLQPEAGGPTWFFGQYLPPSHLIRQGEDSVWFFLDTSATAYGPGSFRLTSERDSGGSMLISWGGSSDPQPTFAPVRAVPEPASVAMLAAGLALLAGFGARCARARTISRCPLAPVHPTRPYPGTSVLA